MPLPSIIYEEAVKHILHYVKPIADYGHCILSQSTNHHCCLLILIGRFSLQDDQPLNIACSLDPITFEGVLRSSLSFHVQSAKAEYRSTTIAAFDLTWITYLLHDIGIYLVSFSCSVLWQYKCYIYIYILQLIPFSLHEQDILSLISIKGCRWNSNHKAHFGPHCFW